MDKGVSESGGNRPSRKDNNTAARKPETEGDPPAIDNYEDSSVAAGPSKVKESNTIKLGAKQVWSLTQFLAFCRGSKYDLSFGRHAFSLVPPGNSPLVSDLKEPSELTWCPSRAVYLASYNPFGTSKINGGVPC